MNAPTFDACRICGRLMRRREHRCFTCMAERMPTPDELIDMLDELAADAEREETRGWTGSYCGPGNDQEGL